jgi:hypothetical protein
MAQISGTVRPLRGSAGVVAEPGVEVFRSLEVEQGNQKGLKRSEGELLDAGLLAGGQDAEAVLEQAEGDANGFGLAAFLLALLKACLPALLAAFMAALLAAKTKNLAVGDAAREVVDGDPTHGADLGNGAAVEA